MLNTIYHFHCVRIGVVYFDNVALVLLRFRMRKHGGEDVRPKVENLLIQKYFD